ncbi:hypothetical protein D910_11414 [Dendroctonus ponderosae]|uniref:Uncharacterized protein n=1 Tax=Dendroctonus ponderosae TaxID=77166 RepID=U4ULY4_DENPD|nr:hypothetical protein D910_11414 [Dendroctonus ponderosae]
MNFDPPIPNDQLKYYQNPKNRRMPEHINLTRPFVMSYTDRWNLYFSWIDQYVAWVRHNPSVQK